MKNAKIFAWLYVSIVLVVFVGQMYVVQFKLIPATLAPFRDLPALEGHVSTAVNKILGIVVFWFLLSLAPAFGYLFVVKKNR